MYADLTRNVSLETQNKNPANTTNAARSINTMPFTTTRDGDGTITVAPKNEADQSATIVICHGLGDSAQGFEDVAEVCPLSCVPSRIDIGHTFIPLFGRLMFSKIFPLHKTSSAHGFETALRQIYSSHSPHPKSHYEHGHGHALLV